MAFWTYIAKVGRPVAAALLYLRSKKIRLVLYSLLVFPATFANLYLAVSRFDPGYINAAIFSLADTVGASVYKIKAGAQLLQGDITREAAFRISEFGGPTVSILNAAVPDISFLPLNMITGFLTNVLVSNEMLAVYMILSALLTPYLFWKLGGLLVQFLSSTTPAIEHYLLFFTVYVLLTMIYGLQHGLGPDVLLQTVHELQAVLDGVASGAANNSTAMVNRSNLSSSP